MRVAAWCVLEPAQEPILLSPGDWIGRALQAALRVDDARISEAHAMVSLRGGALWLLALRGRLYQRGRVLPEVALEEGVQVALADGIVLRCEGVELPDEVQGLVVGSGAPQVLLGTTSLYLSPTPTLRAGFDAQADAVFWTVGDAWRVAVAGQPAVLFRPGTQVNVGTVAVQAVRVPFARAAQTRTRPTLRDPITWQPHAAGVRLEMANQQRHEITGVPGRILAAGLLDDAPDWLQVCATVWPDDLSSVASMRNRLDVGINRLRERLREVGAVDVRVAMDGSGRLMVSLPAVDSVIADAR